MNKIKYAVFFLSLMIGTQVFAENQASYLLVDKKFTSIADVNQQAKAWATCSAAYNVMSTVMAKQNPDLAQQYKTLSNGASLSVAMSHVSSGLSSNSSNNSAKALWEGSKDLVNSIPQTQQKLILEEAKAFGEAGTELFLNKLTNTVKSCLDNLDEQNAYIDSWKDMAQKGLLKAANK